MLARKISPPIACLALAWGAELLVGCASAEHAQGERMDREPDRRLGAPIDREALRREVMAVERAFAASMADRDFASFTAFLSEEAVFLAGPRTLTGKEAVAAAWRPFFEGPAAPFSWQPERVEVLATGRLALSIGPVHDPSGTQVGTFTSVWRREDDGAWRVVFDKGD